ncbi:DsbA family protein [Pseudomonas sp. NC26]|jgi:2-hydroxychromene-2-carboxylate isomerase/predicted thioesterase|uniref:thioesterase, FlK family n=1 Tax=Pseudomonas TaxID=286 RepID=UPI0006D43D27|nr:MULTISPECIES: DsbA family protein [Pseudomonas]MBA6123610.1 DsbA family protein [Pseudomonas juntendi]MCQ1991873.1 DsbA family protein [Pseudomonas sp. Eb3]MEC4879175.1 DsbA family protein [Pseudomonas sp. NC26]PYC07941.1 2-hydroxychromene-2-carboxylate isomerase [Pseudomonas sp. MB-090624]
MSTPILGHQHHCAFVPGLQQTAAAIGNAGVQVVSTPALIALLEETAGSGVQAFCVPGWGTVGTKVDIAHLSPAWPGIEVQCEAVLESTKDRTLSFAVSASQQGRLVMRGHHERVMVDLSRFSMPQPISAGEPIEFFFDFHSPWCYLAMPRLREIAAAHGRAIHWRPMHLANLIDHIGGRRPLEASPAFVRWFQQDLQDWARLRRLTLSYHPQFPLRPSRALRCSLYAIEKGKGAEFIFNVMRAYWTESRDISDLDILGDLAVAAGLDRSATIQAASDERFKLALEANNDQAVQLGVFGAPTVIADSKLFWGNDRLEMMGDYLAQSNGQNN